MTTLDLHAKYALINVEGEKKPKFVSLQSNKKTGELQGIVQDNNALLAPTIIESVSLDDIIAVYPSSIPTFGKAHGINIEAQQHTEKFEKWGKVFYYRSTTVAERKLIQEGYALVYKKIIQKHSLKYLLPISIEVRHNSGKMVGSWHTPKGETTGVMRLCPKTFKDMTAKELAVLITHELGHPLWSSYFSNKLKTRWIRLYHSTLELSECSLEDIATLRKNIISAKSNVQDYSKDLDDEDKLLLKACLDWITTKHKISKEFLNVLIEDGDTLKEYWPKSVLHLSQLQELVTEYGKKNACELWAESFSLYANGLQIPANVKELVERSLKYVSANKEQAGK